MQAKIDIAFNPAHARRRRSRLAASYDSCARLPRTLAERMVEHLQPIRREPRRILELGAATGHLRPALTSMYPDARVISSDDCLDLLLQGRSGGWLRRPPTLLCAPVDRLPVATSSIDMLVCNLALLRTASLDAAFMEWRRVLRHDGVVMLGTLGPLSFSELVAAWLCVDAAPHLHPFPDMHDLGDGLVRAGFCDVVMDSERLRMEFDHLDHLLRELRTVGGGNTRTDRRRTLMTPRTLTLLAESYPRFAPPPGCWATIEVVFAHGWVVERPGTPVGLPQRTSGGGNPPLVGPP